MTNLLYEVIDNPELQKKFNEAYKHVVANMEDESTKATAKRKITIEIIFEQDMGREFVDIDTSIKETLAPKIFKVKMMESGRQLPGQMSYEDWEKEAINNAVDGLEKAAEHEIEAAKRALREKGVDVVDPTTGEVIN